MTVPLNSLFDVEYGNKLDLNKMTLASSHKDGINFVGRASLHHGVSGRVVVFPGAKIYPAGSITVALGGSKLLASFVQLEPFYTAQNVAVLTARDAMTLAEKVFVCLCIRHNRFRYSAFGREANRTLRTLPIPAREDFPAWVDHVSADLDISQYVEPVVRANGAPLSVEQWRPFTLAALFTVRKGARLTQAKLSAGDTPFVSATDRNNGVRQRVSAAPNHRGNLLTVSYNGSVGEVFYQPKPFFASDDINVLYPKFGMNESIGLFLCAVIRREAYRFSYGRKWHAERMRGTSILLPAKDGLPDWDWIERYMAGVPGSAMLAEEIEAPLITG